MSIGCFPQSPRKDGALKERAVALQFGVAAASSAAVTIVARAPASQNRELLIGKDANEGSSEGTVTEGLKAIDVERNELVVGGRMVGIELEENSELTSKDLLVCVNQGEGIELVVSLALDA
ncbi:hypothetical protein GH714_004802 [Hevea brasiliensis]|uniref:Uncharacterized protein n=1 Tax=Hevea brasiliensis TaxID=3981 RepID=A0A6A6MBY0_HEVBR|nr:hypothetical protein GH714_004802 [Hevea brasiliensis]